MFEKYFEKRRFRLWEEDTKNWTYCSKCGDTMEMGILFADITYYSKQTGQPLNAVLAWGCAQIRNGGRSHGHNFHYLKVDMTPMLYSYVLEHKPMGWKRIIDVFEEESQP